MMKNYCLVSILGISRLHTWFPTTTCRGFQTCLSWFGEREGLEPRVTPASNRRNYPKRKHGARASAGWPAPPQKKRNRAKSARKSSLSSQHRAHSDVSKLEKKGRSPAYRAAAILPFNTRHHHPEGRSARCKNIGADDAHTTLGVMGEEPVNRAAPSSLRNFNSLQVEARM